ncbi:MAG: winged helix-turn-helix transcriptional regulator [Halobacteriota archaeon]
MTAPVDERKRATLRRFAALGAATPFVGAAGANAESPEDDNETREAIRGYVGATPGAHFSKLRDDLRLGTGEAQYHLRRLEEGGAIDSIKDGDYRRYYPSGRFTPFERRAIGYLRRDTPRRMILTLLRNPDATGAAIAATLDVSRPTISAAAADLVEAGLLDRSDGYALTEPEQLIALVLRYAESFGPDAVEFATEAASYLTYEP